MNEWEWLTCEDPEAMRQHWFVTNEDGVDRIGVYRIGTTTPKKHSILWQQRGDERPTVAVDLSPAMACNLIREVVGNPFRPVVIPPCSWNTPDVFYFAVNIIESGDYVDVDVLADRLEEAGCDNEEILRHLRGEVRCAECGGDEIARRDGPIFCTVCCNSCWLPKPVPCQPGCWVLRLLTEPQPPPDQSVTFRAGEIEG